jgi:hypothetical protein
MMGVDGCFSGLFCWAGLESVLGCKCAPAQSGWARLDFFWVGRVERGLYSRTHTTLFLFFYYYYFRLFLFLCDLIERYNFNLFLSLFITKEKL